jgi:hypothetical protein
LYRLGIDISYGVDPTDTLIIFPALPHQKPQALVLGSDTDAFIDKEAAAVFKKKIITEYQKKKDKPRAPTNLEVPNVVISYDRNFFTFWVSSIKLAAQLFKSTKLEFKLLPHLDDKLLVMYDPYGTHTVTLSQTFFKAPFPNFSFYGPPPPSIESQQLSAFESTGDAADSTSYPTADLLSQPNVHSSTVLHHDPNCSLPMATINVSGEGVHPILPERTLSVPTPTHYILPDHVEVSTVLQAQLATLALQAQERDTRHQEEILRLTSSLAQITQFLSSLQPSNNPPAPVAEELRSGPPSEFPEPS